MILELYQVNQKYHWAVANSGLIQDVQILNQLPTYGKNGRVVRKVMGLLKHSFVVLMMVRMIALIDVTRWWWTAKKHRNKEVSGSRIFVGFGAGSEQIMWEKFSAEKDSPAIRLDQTDPSTFGQFHRPNLIKLWIKSWRLSKHTVNVIQQSEINLISKYRNDFTTFATMRLGQYVFFRQWWEDMLSSGIKEAVFISADTPAFACLDSRFERVEFRQHGLLRKSLLMPSFPVMKLLTEDEVGYYKNLMPKSRVEIIPPDNVVTKHLKVILLASCYEAPSFHKADYLSMLEEFFLWAKERGFQIIIRRHPCERDGFWQLYFPDIVVDEGTDSFEEAMLRLQPMMMLTWFSTTLIDALRCNVVPVSISTVENRHVQDLIVTLSEHCLMWPEKTPVLDSLVSGDTTVGEIVRGLSGLKRGACEE